MRAVQRGAGPLPWQLAAVLEAANFTAAGHDARQQAQQVSGIIMSLLRLDPAKRSSTQNLCKVSWLMEVETQPLAGCPILF